MTKTKSKKLGKMDFKNVSVGRVHITSTYNNTKVNVTDVEGNTIALCSAGHGGFKGSKKSTPYAGGEIVKIALQKAKEKAPSLSKVYIEVKGLGNGRDTAIKNVASVPGITAIGLKDKTPIPHNGCRRPKKPQT